MKKIQPVLLIIPMFMVFIVLGSTVYSRSSAPSPEIRQVSLMAAFGEKDLDVPYVPTPEDVAAKMLDMAKVNDKDLVYDLGCGDGRIVIMAAQKRGARGIGFDLDPERIYESKQNAERARVTDRVQFLLQDLFTTDLSKATVVTLYLLPSVNLQLRHKLFEQLQPGTRVVSHDFDMGEWEPDETARVSSHTVYSWVIPANATGTWKWTEPARSGDNHCTLTMNQKYQKADGTLDTGKAKVLIRDVRITGDTLRFTADRMTDGRMIPMEYEGRVKGNTIRGSIKTSDGSGAEPVSWKAQRKPSTAGEICEK